MSTERTLDLMWADKPVPAARALQNFSATEVGNGEYVFLDNHRLEYHTLNESAFAIWQLCNGQRTSREIAAALAKRGISLSVEGVELAIVELGEAGLLEITSTSWSAQINRRRVVKMAAAGMLGAAAIPAVASITAPVAAETASECTNAGYTGQLCSGAGNCDPCPPGQSPQCINVSGNPSQGCCACV